MNVSIINKKAALAIFTAAMTVFVVNAQTIPAAPPQSNTPPPVEREPSKIELFKMIELQRDRDLRDLIFKGESPDSRDERGDHALLVAARDGWLDGVRVLLDNRAKPNLRTRVGDSALMVAALGGHEAIVKLLRTKGADINNSGWTALHYAALAGHDKIVRYLLDQGADPAARSPNGVNALMMAARENRTDVIKSLLEYGADPAQKSDNGETALDWAVREEHRQSVDLLKKAK